MGAPLTFMAERHLISQFHHLKGDSGCAVDHEPQFLGRCQRKIYDSIVLERSAIVYSDRD